MERLTSEGLRISDRPIGIIILAAGGSTRFGRPKQLIEFRGKSLIRHSADAAVGSNAGPVIVVTSPDLYEAIKNELEDSRASIAVNLAWQTGMSSSIHVGLKYACELELKLAAVIIALCDQPLVSAETFLRLMSRFRETNKPIIAAKYNNTVGVPALFADSLFDRLLALSGDKGAKSLITQNESDVDHVPAPEAAIDIDSLGDLEKLTEFELGICK